MARSALQFVVRETGATDGKLFAQIRPAEANRELPKAKGPRNPLGLYCCVGADVMHFSDSDCQPFCDSASISAPPSRITGVELIDEGCRMTTISVPTQPTAPRRVVTGHKKYMKA